jgi:hypothetical protein
MGEEHTGVSYGCIKGSRGAPRGTSTDRRSDHDIGTPRQGARWSSWTPSRMVVTVTFLVDF